MRLLNVAFDLTNVKCDFTQPIKLGEAGELSHFPAELLAVNISSLITQQDGHHQDDLKEQPPNQYLQQSTGFFPTPLLHQHIDNPYQMQ